MASTHAMFFCLLAVLQASTGLPWDNVNPMVAEKFMERSFTPSLSEEAISSVDSTHPLEFAPDLLGPSDDTSVEEEEEDEFAQSAHRRVRRQSGAMDLSLSHDDRNGRPRPVGRLHGYVQADGSGNSRNDFHVNTGLGLGTVGWRSRNGRHSVGVGATVDQSRGRFNGRSYRSRPSYGVGIGYRYRF